MQPDSRFPLSTRHGHGSPPISSTYADSNPAQPEVHPSLVRRHNQFLSILHRLAPSDSHAKRSLATILTTGIHFIFNHFDIIFATVIEAEYMSDLYREMIANLSPEIRLQRERQMAFGDPTVFVHVLHYGYVKILVAYARDAGLTEEVVKNVILQFATVMWEVTRKRLARRIDEWTVLDGLRYKEVWIGMMPQIITASVSLVAHTTNISARSFFTGTFFARSRLRTYYLLAVPQSLISPSRYLLLAALPMLHTFFFSVYSPFPYSNTHLNSTLHHHGYSLIARQESYTGYISVLDNNKDGFRVMRCDHSLLGGEWFPQPGYESQLREPVYAIFVMLEAVRLVQSVDDPGTKPEVQDRLKSALVIGLGIGTTPSALIAHGIDTTIIEIDPTVHDFAARYFNLPSNHTPIIDDAIVFVDRNKHQKRYDYIIHDVFTGGAEPIELFTVEFLTGLKEMLSADGVIAINYAGDLHLPTAHTIIHTILTVFPHCRLFRESPAPPSPSSTTSPLETDFTNLVLFCRRSAGAFVFRSPRKADFLGTQARKHHLLPRYEVDAAGFLGKGDADVVRKNNTHIMEASQMRGAVGHWAVMRTVVPDAVWESW
ncbi:hypothetical protein XANCAGTX0491_000714 [Xanthoria calcicola]